MLDNRYKITPKIIDEMKAMRRQGLSYAKIAQAFGLSPNTAYYWLDEGQRLKQRDKNAKRRYDKSENKERYLKYKERRTELWNANPNQRLRNAINSAKFEEGRKTIRGMSIEDAIKELDLIDKLPNGKID